ncbi:MAG: hypothetical protein OXC96_03720 [Cyanobacteria bacterium MAG CAR1_bin_15]|nr:hypothetical protein [Cyanobacteria bacterium MAG CAR1_bin_15]
MSSCAKPGDPSLAALCRNDDGLNTFQRNARRKQPMNTQNGPPMTVHTNARIPAATDTVVTDRMGLDLGISQVSNEWL